MFELNTTADLPTTVGAFSDNLSVYYYEPKFTTFAAVCGKNQVNVLQWDTNYDQIKSDVIVLSDKDTGTPITAVQCKICAPADKNYPVLVVSSFESIRIYDIHDLKLLISIAVDKNHDLTEQTNSDDDELPANFDSELYKLSRGITFVDNAILVGSDGGNIMVFSCSGESVVSFKKSLTEHKCSIIGLATCIYDHFTVSADIQGNVAVWSRNLKNVTRRISTGQCISSINILRKHALCGTYQGQVLFYNVLTGELVAEVSAHAREVTAISVAPESAYILTASQDGHICIWKLHTRKPEAFSVEFRHCEKIQNKMLTGAQFANGRGNGFVAAAYDHTKLNIYRIAKKLTH